MTLSTYSRADGHSAVKAAAYRARSSYLDQRTGLRHSYRGRTGLMSDELIGWAGSAEALWNAAEAAEIRSNARTSRELRPALPAELPLDHQVRLVRGFALWLRDRYGVAVQGVIHAPTFTDPDDGKAFWRNGIGTSLGENELDVLRDPKRTNQNFHAHIHFTTRAVDTSGAFLAKTRVLDDKMSGPEELRVMRQEWQRRTNSMLEKIGCTSRIDMRSYADMARAGDAPETLVPQDHIGPRRTARTRKRVREQGKDSTHAGKRRAAVQEHNAQAWHSWLLARAAARDDASRKESARIAAAREAERKADITAIRSNILNAQSQSAAEEAAQTATHLDSLELSPMAQAMAWAHRSDPTDQFQDEYSEEIDLETYSAPSRSSSAEPALQVRVLPDQARTLKR